MKKFDFSTKTFFIAELSANHNHNLDIALKTIKAAKKAGADAIKLQTYTPDTLTINCNNKYFKIDHGTVWDGKTLYELYNEAYTPWDWHEQLFKYAREIDIEIFSTPFDRTAVDFLEKFKPFAYKIASFEITDIPLIRYVASKQKPIIISTGIATLDEIHDAVQACRKENNNNITLLKCTSAYPAPYEEANLLTIKNLEETFNVSVGLSDHTLGYAVALASVALGAKIIEKHFILDKSISGPDASFSMLPEDFAKMVSDIRIAEKAFGKVSYEISLLVEKNRIFKRSLFVIEDINAGEKFSKQNVRSIRPGYGLPPKYLDKIINKRAKVDIKKGTPLSWDLLV